MKIIRHFSLRKLVNLLQRFERIHFQMIIVVIKMK